MASPVRKMIKKTAALALSLCMITLCSCDSDWKASESVTSFSAEQSTSVMKESTQKETVPMKEFDFSIFRNVTITGIDTNSLSPKELSVLYTQAEYCQAMTDADIVKLREIVSEDKTFTHMSGMKQTRDEYFADIADGSLDYHTIGIEDPVIAVNGNSATITFTSVLNANAYGAIGTFRMKGTHHYESRNGKWIAV